MLSESEYKKNHFVPKTYLRRFTNPYKWTESINYINSLNINNNVIRQSNIDDQCQKKNLYKLPENFNMEEKKAIEKAFMGHIDKIYAMSMSNSYDQGLSPSNAEMNSLLWFVIYQSFRTPKFKYHHLIKAAELQAKLGKSDSDLEEYTYWLGYLLVKVGLDIFKYSLLEILLTREHNWFLTSDNPASYWLKTWNKSGFVGTTLGNSDKTNLKLLCPINPQISFVLHINYLKNSSTCNSAEEIHYINRTIEKEESDYINNLIYSSCDKLIFSLDQVQLEKFKKINLRRTL